MGMFSRKKSTEEVSKMMARPPEQKPKTQRRQPPESPPPASVPTKPSKNQAVGNSCSVINAHLVFDGNLKYEGTLTIDCEIRGTITTDDTLVVGPAAKIQAEISAGAVEISGKVRGNIRAKQSVKVLAGGEVYGNIETPNISMEEGVVFEGQCTRPQPGKAAPMPATSPRPSSALRPLSPATSEGKSEQKPVEAQSSVTLAKPVEVKTS